METAVTFLLRGLFEWSNEGFHLRSYEELELEVRFVEGEG